MSKFRRNSIIVLILELIIIVVFNIVLVSTSSSNTDRQYRVDISRIQTVLEAGEVVNPDDYDSVIAIKHFDDTYKTNNDYAVINCGGTLYSVEYKTEYKNNSLIYMDIGLGVTFVLTAGILFYVDTKVLKPFNKLSNYSTELAKGNLSKPIKEEKSKHFGKFVWGMDMLRETLEDNKKKELKLQKDKKTLILSISHDIKTPLSAIKLYTKALEEDIYESPEKKKEAIKGIEKNIEEINGYVSEIVSASREDFMNLTVTMGELYLKDLITKIDILYREKFSNIHTEFELGEYENCLLQGDENRLEEVLQNILENAIKYGDGRFVRLNFDEEEGCQLIRITSSGCTVKQEELPHLFDSFYRGGNSSKCEGSGLGLYIAKSLLRMMGGDIYAELGKDEFSVTVVVKKC